MSESDAYAAGLFDGEGHIAITYTSGYGVGKSRYPRYQLAVSMSQNSKEPLEWLVENYGGSLKFVKGRRSYDRGFYERWNWYISTSSAADFLKTIYPFSIVKLEEIKIALAFQSTMDANLGRSKLPQEVIDFRKYCFEQIRSIRKNRVA